MKDKSLPHDTLTIPEHIRQSIEVLENFVDPQNLARDGTEGSQLTIQMGEKALQDLVFYVSQLRARRLEDQHNKVDAPKALERHLCGLLTVACGRLGRTNVDIERDGVYAAFKISPDESVTKSPSVSELHFLRLCISDVLHRSLIRFANENGSDIHTDMGLSIDDAAERAVNELGATLFKKFLMDAINGTLDVDIIDPGLHSLAFALKSDKLAPFANAWAQAYPDDFDATYFTHQKFTKGSAKFTKAK